MIIKCPQCKREVGKDSGHFVMRNLDYDRFEVMDLSDFRTNVCWIGCPDLLVRSAPVGTKITFEVVE